jgi:hypothetical protein
MIPGYRGGARARPRAVAVAATRCLAAVGCFGRPVGHPDGTEPDALAAGR